MRYYTSRLPQRQATTIASLALACLLLLALVPAAQALTINEDNTMPGTVIDLTGYATTGSDMVGMQVTAYFTDGSTETVPWASTGAGNGQAAGTGWTLYEFGDTFGSPTDPNVGLWKVSVQEANVFIDQLLLKGVDAKLPERGVVFDRTQPTPFGTHGSYRGRDFEVYSIATIVGLDPGFDDLEVTYRVPIDSQADGPGIVGDLFGELLINPIRTGSTEAGIFYAANELTFHADTDTVGQFDPGSFDPGNPEHMPEPASLTLLGIAAAMLLVRRRTAKGG